MAGTLSLSADAFAWALQGLCRLHRIPFASGLVLQQFPPPYDLTSLQRAATALGLRSGLHERITVSGLSGLALPAVAFLHAEGRAVPEEDACRPVIVLSCSDGRVHYLEPGAHQPSASPCEDFQRQFAGCVMSCAPGTPEPADPDAAAVRQRPFGFRWFVPELLRHRAIWRDVLLASLAIQLMALATPIFTQVIIDKVIVHQTLSTLAVIGIALGLFMIFSAVMSWVRQYLVLHTGNRIDAVLGAQVFDHLFRLPPRYFEHRPTGVLVARVQGVETIREFLSSAAVTLILDVPFLLVFLAIMAYYSVTLTLLAVGILLLIAGLSVGITPLLRARLDRQFLLGARNQAFLTEYVAGMETVKSLQMEPQLNRRFGDYLAHYLQAGFATRTLANSYSVAAGLLEQLMILMILCVGAWMVITTPGFTIGMLVAFQMFASRLSQPLLHLVSLWQQFQQAEIAVRRLGDVMNAPAEPYSVMPSRENRREGRIEIVGLSFRYAENRPYLLKSFSLTVESGACVAVMGPSGSGKSTLARLLQGFYLAEEGAILLDGRDTRHLGANELRSYFGVVPQETVLFSGTIYENLLLADPHASFDRVVQACRLAEIHQTIEQLPEGYQTKVGEHGIGLSGGQKQRIAIARALLKRPRILLFDEATSGLDPQTAEQFARTVNQLKGRVTMLFITHHLTRGLQVDSVVTLGQWGTKMGVVGEERRDA